MNNSSYLQLVNKSSKNKKGCDRKWLTNKKEKVCAEKGALCTGFLKSGCLVEGCAYFIVNSQNCILSYKMATICRHPEIIRKTERAGKKEKIRKKEIEGVNK